MLPLKHRGGGMQDFRNLAVLAKSHRLALDVCVVSADLLNRREFNLRNQMVRAAMSIPANIAEGCDRSGDRELRRFCRMALGSGSELEYHLTLARDLGLLPGPVYERLASQVVEVKRMLSGLIRCLGTQTDG
jgi:four helix bundle protein